MRHYYSDFVSHCLKFYARYPKPVFKTDADKVNWEACRRALSTFTEEEQQILVYVYRERDTMEDNVYNASVIHNIDQDLIWKMIMKLEKRVAKRRGLI